MCGIFCRVGDPRFSPADVLRGLRRIDYRGYDSFGVVGGGVAVKAVGEPITDLHVAGITTNFIAPEFSLAVMGHTRWATHGGNTIGNCQPIDCAGILYKTICHNGMVTSLTSRFGESDTKTVAELIKVCTNSKDLFGLLNHLEGKNAFVVHGAVGENQFFHCFTKDMPLYAGEDSISFFVTSNLKAIDGDLKYVKIPDGVLVRVDKDGVSSVLSGNFFKLKNQSNPVFKEYLETTFMLDEIKQQESILNLKLSKINLKPYKYVVACGSSYNAAIYGSFSGKYKLYYPDEIMYLKEFSKDFKIRDGELLVISQSGETMDIIRAVDMLGVKYDCLVNNEGIISLHKHCDKVFKLRCGEERSVAATKSFLSTVVRLYGNEIAGLKNETGHRFGVDVVYDDVKNFLDETNLHKFENIFLLYDTNNSFLAHEGALKLKEVAGVHAEPIHVKEVRHGTLSLLTRKTDPCISLSPISEDVEKQLESRNIPCYTLNKYFSIFDKLFFLQLLSHEIGSRRGYDVDRPVGIAKCITV